MHLFTTVTTALTALSFLSHAAAYKWDKKAAEFGAGKDWFSDIMPPPEGSWGKLLVDENEQCYIVLNEVYDCKGRSEPFATYNATTGYCDAYDGAEPMTTPICGGYLWFFRHAQQNAFVQSTHGEYNLTGGELFMKSHRYEVNLVPYRLSKAGCGFSPVYKDGEFQHLDQPCGLVRKPVGKWSG
ncbi:hypothetical protein P170DRAFT_438279 [Aspergillus steynii IBT 23096]|uniref:Uncharacterized protein n=1 Tax=Aspergillus steynii IBT 23096 TaxID=1392250 RepID=A0A2I2G0V6_9EURO|nr:uncharacterized protein P170DRAFT_438279 [Aspergillus steynii IBT 23096]PLB46517.1 hypothetical protein P170DRAFT_438279 [Aspergillus steynii IBT 23096]